jgi:hypothetical protein
MSQAHLILIMFCALLLQQKPPRTLALFFIRSRTLPPSSSRMRSIAFYLAVVLLLAVSVRAQSSLTCCERDPDMCTGSCIDDYDADGINYGCHCSMASGTIAAIVISSILVAIACVIVCRLRYRRRQMWMGQAAQPIFVPQQQAIYAGAYPGGGYGMQDGYAAPAAYAPNANFSGQPHTTGMYHPSYAQPAYGRPAQDAYAAQQYEGESSRISRSSGWRNGRGRRAHFSRDVCSLFRHLRCNAACPVVAS